MKKITLKEAREAAGCLIHDAIRNQVAHPAYKKFTVKAVPFGNSVKVYGTIELKNTHVFNGGRKFNKAETYARLMLAKVAIFRASESNYGDVALDEIVISSQGDGDFKYSAFAVPAR